MGDFENPEAHLGLQRPLVKIRDIQANRIIERTPTNVPDFIAVSGLTNKNVSLLTRFRAGQPFPGEAPLTWTINGENGEIRLIARGGTTLHASAYSEPVTIEIHDFETDRVEEIDWKWETWQEELPMIARSIGMVYEKFADEDKVGLAAFEDALIRHQQLEGFLDKWHASRK